MVVVAGNVGSAEAKTINTKNGETTVLNFTVAENLRGRDGEKRTNWYRAAIFGRFAEAMKPYIVKGTTLQVSGDLLVRQYDRRDGGTGIELDVENPSITLLGGNRESGEQKAERPAEQSKPPVDEGFINVPDGMDVSIPFA